jgi:hypothetical protein
MAAERYAKDDSHLPECACSDVVPILAADYASLFPFTGPAQAARRQPDVALS